MASFVNHDADTISFYLVLTSALSMAADVYFREGKELKMAAAGLERLTLRNEEREGHCDAAALLVGYTLGLPCFCFRPDVLEALRLFRDAPSSLEAFKQPLARPSPPSSPSSSSGNNVFQSAFDAIKVLGVGGSSNKKATDLLIIPSLSSNLTPETDIFSIGRVLIWLMVMTERSRLETSSFISF